MGNGEEMTLFTKDDTTGEYVEYTPPEPPAFKDKLPEDIRGSEHLSDVEDEAQLARYYVDMKSNQLVPPDSADGYEFEAPEGFEIDQETYKSFQQAAFDQGLNQKQFSELMKFEVNRFSNALAAVDKTIDDRQAEAETALKNEWGNDYEKNLEAAKAVINHESLASDEFKEFLNETRFGDNPQVIRFFHKLSNLISEDVFSKSGDGSSSGEPGIKRGEDGRPMLSFPSMDGDK